MLQKYSLEHLDTPPAIKSDLHMLLNDLNHDKKQKHSIIRQNHGYNVNSGNDSSDIEDDLALLLNDRQERTAQRPLQTNNPIQPSKLVDCFFFIVSISIKK